MNFSDLIDRDSFIKSVRRASVTLRDTSLIANEDILDIGLNETYPRIALILITTKAKDEINHNTDSGSVRFMLLPLTSFLDIG